MGLRGFFLLFYLSFSFVLYASMEQDVPSICTDNIVCERIGQFFPNSKLATVCKNKTHTVKLKHDKSIQSLLGESFIHFLESINLKDINQEDKFFSKFDDDILEHIEFLLGNSKKVKKHLLKKEYIWEKLQSDGLFYHYLLHKFALGDPGDVAKSVACFCHQWEVVGYKKKAPKRIKTKVKIGKLKEKRQINFSNKVQQLKARLTKLIDSEIIVHNMISVQDENVILHNSSIYLDMVNFGKGSKFNNKIISFISDYFSSNKEVESLFLETVKESFSKKIAKISGQYLNINYQAEIYLTQAKNFITYLERYPKSSDERAFSTVAVAAKACLEKDIMEQYDCLSSEAVFDNLVKVILATKVVGLINKKIKICNNSNIYKIYSKFFPTQHKYSDIDTPISRSYSQDIDILNTQTIDNIISMGLDSIYIFFDTYKNLKSLLPKKRFIQNGYEYNISLESDSLILIKRKLKGAKVFKKIEVYFDGNRKEFTQARKWFDKIQALSDCRIINAYMSIHPMYTTLFMMLEVYKRKGSMRAAQGENFKDMYFIESELLAFYSTPSRFKELAMQIEGLNYIRSVLKDHLLIWENMFIKKFNELLEKSADPIVSLVDAYKFIIPSIDLVVSVYAREEVKFTEDEKNSIICMQLLKLFVLALDKAFFIHTRDGKDDKMKVDLLNYPIFVLFDVLDLRYPLVDSFYNVAKSEINEGIKSKQEILTNGLLNIYKSYKNGINRDSVSMFSLLNTGDKRDAAKGYDKFWVLLRKTAVTKISTSLIKVRKYKNDKIFFERLLQLFIWRIDYFIESIKDDPCFLFYNIK